jgi:transposase
MKKIVRQVVGMDVAQKELVVCLGRMREDLTPEVYAHKSFANTKTGFQSLETWVKKLTDPAADLRFVMEATGVYHESVAYYLEGQGYQISIVLPNKISNYARTLETRTITDKTASEAITQFGLERKLENWKRPHKIFKTLRQLNRERAQIVEERTIVKNHLHAEKAEAEPNKTSIDRIQKRIQFLNKQEKQVKEEIVATVKKDETVASSAKLLSSLSGIGLITASTVLGETNGFELIRNKKQLTSYSGLDVIEKQSGTSIRGKSRISKRGNKHLRKAMHMPALAAIRHDERFKNIFARLVARHGIKMKAVVAVQRKLLEMHFTIYKTQQPYDKNYLNKKNTKTICESL